MYVWIILLKLISPDSVIFLMMFFISGRNTYLFLLGTTLPGSNPQTGEMEREEPLALIDKTLKELDAVVCRERSG